MKFKRISAEVLCFSFILGSITTGFSAETAEASAKAETAEEITLSDSALEAETAVVEIGEDEETTIITEEIKNPDFSGLSGSGTTSSPFIANSEDTLLMVSDFPSSYWKLTSDITLTSSWTPIEEFSGVLDGNGHTISGISITTKGNAPKEGFFVVNSGTIKNLALNGKASYTASHHYDALFVYKNTGTIEGCLAEGSISLIMNDAYSCGSGKNGGFVGLNDGTIKNCYSHIAFTYSKTGNSGSTYNYLNYLKYTCGFAGYNEGGTIENCYSISYLTNSSYSLYGFGHTNGGTYTSCYYDKNLNGVSSSGGGSYKTTTAMKMLATYTNWDFDSVWAMDSTESINDGYPYLRCFYGGSTAATTTTTTEATTETTTKATTTATTTTETTTKATTTTTTTTEATTEATTESGNVTDSDFEFDASTGTITGYTGTATNVVIPSAIDGVTVKSIGEYAFWYCDEIVSVTIPNTVVNIDEGAFYLCDSLTSITIPNSVATIGAYAFWYCYSLTSITIPDSVVTIGESALEGCYSLTSIIIPSSVASIGKGAFCYCKSLTDIYVDSENQYFTSVDGVLYNEAMTMLVHYPAGQSGSSYAVPDGVVTVGAYAFGYNNNLTSVVLPDGLMIIEENAFLYCSSLASITIPDSVTTIGVSAFAVCYSLTSITIPNSVISIDSSAFEDCENLTVYCYEGSTADDESLYPTGTSINYISGEVTTETSTETTTAAAETTAETTTEGEPVAAPAFKVVGVFGGRSVTFTSETDGAVIYYSSSTSNLTTDDICIANGETVTYEDYYGTIYTRAYYNGVWSDVSKFVLKIPVVNTPTVTASGSVVTVKSTTPSSFICYTTDGTEPVIETDGTVTNGTWLKVNGARTNSGTITAEPGDTVRAVAVRNCFTTSASAAAYVSVSPAAFTVVGTFGGRNVTFNSDTSGAKIYYSSTTSSLTTSDKCVSNGETVLFEDFYGTIYARAYYNGKWSNVSRLILKIPTINTPTITYSGGKATIRTTTPSCYIYYTTDDTTPSIANGKKLCSNSYGQITVSSGTTVKAIAVRSCFTNSEIVSCKVS